MNYNTKGLLFVLQVNWCKSQRTVVKEYIVVHLVHLDLLFLVSVKKILVSILSLGTTKIKII